MKTPKINLKKVLTARLMVISILVLIALTRTISFTVFGFTDVSDGAWYKTYIDKATAYNVPINGYPDGTFKPDGQITYAEFMRLLSVTLTGNDSAKITSSKYHWGLGYLLDAQSRNIISTEEKKLIDTSYMDTPIKRKDVTTYIGRAVERAIKKEMPSSSKNFMDIKKLTEEEKKYITGLAEVGVINGYPGNTFKPENTITRAEIVKILTVVIEKYGLIDPEGREFKTENLPSNASSYAYMSKDVDNSLYEIPFEYDLPNAWYNAIPKDSRGDTNPKDTYKAMGDGLINQKISTKEMLSWYKKIVEEEWAIYLNIDPDTISAQDLYNKINRYNTSGVSLGKCERYVANVKENGIRIKLVSVKAEPSIVYRSKDYAFIRTQVSFDLDAKNPKNVLLDDYNYEVYDYTTYENGRYNIVIDTPILYSTNYKKFSVIQSKNFFKPTQGVSFELEDTANFGICHIKINK